MEIFNKLQVSSWCFLFVCLFGVSYREHNWFWVPILGPHLGAPLGALLYQGLVGLHFPDDVPLTDPALRDTYVDKSVKRYGEKEKLGIQSFPWCIIA